MPRVHAPRHACFRFRDGCLPLPTYSDRCQTLPTVTRAHVKRQHLAGSPPCPCRPLRQTAAAGSPRPRPRLAARRRRPPYPAGARRRAQSRGHWKGGRPTGVSSPQRMPDERSTHRRELQRLPGERLLPLQVLLAPPLLPLLQHRHAELSQPSQLDAGLAEITCAARKRCLSSGCIACTGAPTVSWAATATQRSTPTTRHSRLHANDPRWAGPAGQPNLESL